jgi:hypothetical protein
MMNFQTSIKNTLFKPQVALWHHRASHHPSGLVVWDYHVVVMVKSSSTSKCTVYDLDIADSSGEASLGVPCDMTTYAAAVLSPSNLFPPRKYRIIPAENFFKHFASDRSHMIKPADPQATTAIGTATGQYRAPPPPYPPIVAPDGNTHTLDYYLDMSSSLIDEGDFPHSIKNIWSGKYGVVMKERVFLEWAILH